MKQKLLSTLTADSELVSLVGKIKSADKMRGNIPCIFSNTPSSWDTLPAVVFLEKDGGDAVFADDVCIARTVTIQIDVYARTSVTKIFDRVRILLRQMGFICTKVMDVPEPTHKHRLGIFNITVYDEEEN